MRAVMILARTDGLFCYREDQIYEDAEVLPYWREGYPVSGLFATSIEAEASARQSIEWLRNFK
jgi:hypothetical protein